MNKISKKIVALATMAAFVLTLVPVAAFAVEAPKTSTYSVNANSQEVTLDDNNATITVDFTAGTDVADDNFVFWLVKDGAVNAAPYTHATFEAVEGSDLVVEPGDDVQNTTVWDGTGIAYDVPAGSHQININVPEAGTYWVCVGVSVDDSATSLATLEMVGLATGGTATAVVNPAEVVTDYITLANGNGGGHMETLTKDEPISVLDFTNSAVIGDFKINGTDTYTITGTAFEEDNTPAPKETFKLSASRGDAVIDLVDDEVTTDSNGEFSITFRMKENRNDTINIVNEDVNYAIRVIVDEDGAFDIKTVEDDGYVLAGTDSHWDGSETVRNFASGVQFEITDEDGNLVTGDEAIAAEPMQSSSVGLHDQYMTIIDRPEGSTLTAADLAVVENGDTYTLYYNHPVGEAEDDLIPGKYTVRVALQSGKYATATFTAAEYGTTQDILLNMQATDRSNNRTVTLDDEVTLGQSVNVTAVYVDENGIKIPANNVQYGAVGEAVVDVESNGTFATKADTESNASLIGTTITVSAFSEAEKKLVQKELTVVDSYNTYSLEFTPTQGEVNADNDVTVTVVNADGKRQQVAGTMYAYVADQSNEDARVVVDIDNNNVVRGEGELTVFADQETTVDVVVGITDNNNDAIYAGTLEFTVGAEDPNAENTVVMTIGSTDYVVNNDIVKGDAAPYVDDAWRTMVPFRVLGETFGATVDWDQEAQSVTYIYGDTELVMTIGEDTYTINGEEFDMDTAPVLSGDRTYVPVRFVGEALGYTVTALYDGETGLTASVVFQK